MKKPRGKKKRKKNKRGGRRKQTALAIRTDRIEVRIDRLELVRGHDGFLRGAPEPVIVCGLFSIAQRGPKLLARGIAHFEQPRGSYPCTVVAREGAVLTASVPRDAPPCVVLVTLAFEEDGGEDVLRAYAALERADHIALFDEAASSPAPLELPDLTHDLPTWAAPRPVHLMIDGAHFVAGDDDWVAGAALAAARTGKRVDHRAHYVAADGRNDWTAELTLFG